jgi:NADH-quinone oxidoreductase subunit M
MLLALTTGVVGVFVALDMFLFYVFWEMMLIPMYFLIGVWGGKERIYAAVKFFLYTAVGSLLMLVAILYLFFRFQALTGVASFSYFDFLQLPLTWASRWLFAAFALAFAIKVPIFPFHTWLPAAHVQAPTAGSVILAGVLLKMGTYGFLRFALPLFPARRRADHGDALHGARGDRHHLHGDGGGGAAEREAAGGVHLGGAPGLRGAGASSRSTCRGSRAR